MTIEDFFRNIEKHLREKDMSAMDNELELLFSSYDIIDCSNSLAFYINKSFTHFKAGFYAVLLEKIIRKKPQIALIQLSKNPLFKLCIARGSNDLYECYMEEAIEPFLEDKDEIETEDTYMDLYAAAMEMNDFLFENYTQCIKGMHYNGAFATHESLPNVELINLDDYQAIENVVASYNSIIGRRDIIKDLDQRFNPEDE